jgi:hypothetical protein
VSVDGEYKAITVSGKVMLLGEDILDELNFGTGLDLIEAFSP